MRFISFSLIAIYFFWQTACNAPEAPPNRTANQTPAPPPVAEKFAYPLGPTGSLTQARDKKDDWYNAQDFGANDHLGEDWNKNSGGDTDCGAEVFAIAAGRIVYADNAGPGWGNVVIIEHILPDGTKVRSLYGHLQKILKKTGDVNLRERIGEVGGADGRYPCHLHLELRAADCPAWNEAGGGYAADRKGWLDPSDFIDKHR